MARWTVTPGSKGNTMSGKIDYGGIGEQTHWEIAQDITPHLEEVKRDRDLLATGRHNNAGFRKMATIPDIVALRIFEDHKLDIHDPMFGDNPINFKRLRHILKTEYPELLVST